MEWLPHIVGAYGVAAFLVGVVVGLSLKSGICR